MGISLWVGETDEEYRLTNAYWYNEFLNYCAERGDCDNLLYFTPDVSVALKEHKGERALEVFSLDELAREVNRILLDNDAPDYANYIAQEFLKAIEEAEDTGETLVIL